MTFPYPSEPAPDGAYVMGGRYGQDVTESTVTQIVRGGALTGFAYAQESWRGITDDLAAQAASIRDAQLDLTDRVDLLEGVNGYGSVFLLLTLIRVIRSSDDR